MDLLEVGKTLRQARKKLNISQVELARQCGLSRATISAFESGKTQELGFRRINAIAQSVGLELTLVPTTHQPKTVGSSKLLEQLRKRYIWWEIPGSEPDESRVIAQVMELGTYEDVKAMEKKIGLPKMMQVLMEARPGWFSGKSWHYWHLRLGLSQMNHIPPLPRREHDIQSQL